jgi:hypothetical protein
MDSEIMAIRTAIRTGNVEEAMTGIYLATRKIAMIHGLDVPDSMTHKEFYAGITGKYPALSTPLTYILYPYEIVAFAGRLASEEELNSAINGLKEFYFKLENEEVGTS